jgi:hypothetical protein
MPPLLSGGGRGGLRSASTPLAVGHLCTSQKKGRCSGRSEAAPCWTCDLADPMPWDMFFIPAYAFSRALDMSVNDMVALYLTCRSATDRFVPNSNRNVATQVGTDGQTDRRTDGQTDRA